MPHNKQYHLVSSKRTVAIISIGIVVVAVLVASLFFFIAPNGDCTIAMYENPLSGNAPLTVTITLTEQTCQGGIEAPYHFQAEYEHAVQHYAGRIRGAAPTMRSMSKLQVSGPATTFTVTLPAAGNYYPVGMSTDNGGRAANVEGGVIQVGSTSTSTTLSTSSTGSTQTSGLSITSLSPNGIGGTSSFPVGSTVSFGVVVSGGQQPYSYAWSFGYGGASATSQSPTFQYPSAGTFTVK